MTFADFVCVLGSAACADEAGAGWVEARSTAWGRHGAQRGEARLGLVGGGLVFFDRRKRNLGCTCSRVPAEDSDGERAHHKENQAGRG